MCPKGFAVQVPPWAPISELQNALRPSPAPESQREDDRAHAVVDQHREPDASEAEPDRIARCGSRIPSDWPTSAADAAENPTHGRNESDSSWLTSWCAA